MKKYKDKFLNIFLVINSKINRYKTKFILRQKLLSRNFSEFITFKLENLKLEVFRKVNNFTSKEDNVIFLEYIGGIPYLLICLFQIQIDKTNWIWWTCKNLSLFWYQEIKLMLLDFYYGIRYIILFPWNIYKGIQKIVYTPWNKDKIIATIKVPVVFRLYRFFKKQWLKVWNRIDYDWYAYSLSLYLVNYNLLFLEVETRWYTYGWDKSISDFAWLAMFPPR